MNKKIKKPDNDINELAPVLYIDEEYFGGTYYIDGSGEFEIRDSENDPIYSREDARIQHHVQGLSEFICEKELKFKEQIKILKQSLRKFKQIYSKNKRLFKK
jgi:hypothetical protein